MTDARPTSPDQKRSAGRPKDMAKRDAMLDAAACLFFRNGLEAVTMEAVAREAGVSKVTVYGHFATKETLFGSVIRRETATIRQGLAQLPVSARQIWHKVAANLAQRLGDTSHGYCSMFGTGLSRL